MTAPTDPGSAPQAGPRLRASDAEREAVAHRLHDAVGRGLLTIEEGHERVTAAFAAKYVDELGPLTADLPDPTPVAPGWRALRSTAALQARTSLVGASSWHAADRRRRRAVLVGLIMLAVLLVAIVTAAATAASGDFGGGGWDGGWSHHHHDDGDDD